MKKVIVALLFAFGSTAFAHEGVPTCKELVENTASIITLTPILSASNPIEAGSNVVFAAVTEGVYIGTCTAHVTLHAGELVLIGMDHLVKAGMCVVEGTAGLIAKLFECIFGHILP